MHDSWLCCCANQPIIHSEKKTNHIYQQKKTNYIDKKNKKNPTKNFTTIIRIHQKTITKSRHKKIGMMRLMIGMMFFSVD